MTRGNPAVLNRIPGLGDLAVCQTALGELYFGVERSGRRRVELKKLRNALVKVRILDVDRPTARTWGTIKAQLAAAGTPIPENDIWIAAAAVRHGFMLITHDAHFRRVAGLVVDVWPKV